MSIRVMDAVWRNFPDGGTELLAMLALADWCNDEGGSLHPSIGAVAKRIRTSESQARRVVHKLIGAHWIEVVGNKNGGAPGTSRKYQLNVAKLAATGSIHARGGTDATPRMDARDGSHGCAETASTHASLSVKKQPLENHQSSAQRFASRFDEFWALYPKRVARAACLKRWKAHKLDGNADAILAKLKQQVDDDARWADGYIPDPLTYLNGERWEDEIQPRKGGSASLASITPAGPAKPRDPRSNSESPLDNVLAYIRNQHAVGAYGEGPDADAERDRLLTEARRKHAPAEERAEVAA